MLQALEAPLQQQQKAPVPGLLCHWARVASWDASSKSLLSWQDPRPQHTHKHTKTDVAPPQVLDYCNTPGTLYPSLGLHQWNLALIHTVRVTFSLLAWVIEATLNPGWGTWPKVTWAWPI